jgi:hypothetical protein
MDLHRRQDRHRHRRRAGIGGAISLQLAREGAVPVHPGSAAR